MNRRQLFFGVAAAVAAPMVPGSGGFTQRMMLGEPVRAVGTWSIGTQGGILKDVSLLLRQIQDYGVRPNVVFMDPEIYEDLIQHPAIVERLA